MSYEHKNGLSCSEIEDELEEMHALYQTVQMSMNRIHTLLGMGLERPSDELRRAARRAYREASERCRL
jgi:hypothetical protein